MGILDDIFGSGNAAKAAEDAEKKYMQPYDDYGLAAGGALSGAMHNLLDPTAMMGKWASSYQESPEAKQLEATAQNRGMDAASAMGLMGSSPALRAIQSGTTGIMANDRQNYLQNLMHQYQLGTGVAQNMYGIGANMGQALGQGIGGLEGQSKGSGLSGLGGIIGAGLGWMGGLPGVGSAVGSKIGGMIKGL